ncbi:hypothetical protein ACFFTM_05395 [Pseudoduganella plicata]|uniref:Uncharacterized protein n=1 Tax=Pseudoduganella plicata TaxID=321984 RepID=A0A4P7BJT0_9BURK|nr:hypothetical protein [Pseudoduganella plicata]QBQ38700.1 hypothetical protein E1742_22900 [Pseudoduganella plicata]GGY84359.1 hypothetical protein GCM10007388_16800 [Pseudoduganella plicata]
MPGEETTELSLTPHSTAPQFWTATVAESKFYWYDLLAGGGPLPDFRDPVGRYLRRMQFALDGTMEKRLLYFLIARPRVRIDTHRNVSWGFFSLKLTIPILLGAAERKSTLTIDLDVPFEATLKKPTVQLQDKFLLLNWGALTETLSIHDLIQRYQPEPTFPSTVLYVGQTHDPAGKLAKGLSPLVNRLRESVMDENDTFLLIQRMDVKVETTARDMSEEASVRTQTDLIEGALIRYFEGPAPRARKEVELGTRRERLEELQKTYLLERLTVDLGFKDADAFHELTSEHVPIARRHLFECVFDHGTPELKTLSAAGRPLVELKN